MLDDPVQTLLQKMIQRGFDPVEAVGLVTEVLATRGVDHTAAKRRQWDREYRRRKRAKHPPDIGCNPPDIHPTSTRHNGTYVEVPYVKPMYVKEKEVKEEASNEEASNAEIKKEMVNHSSIKDTELSRTRTRARKKSGTEFPQIWPIPEVIEIGIGFGFSLEETQNELAAMQDWALSKDERRVNWIAFARKWFRTAKKGSHLAAKPKPMSPHLENIHKNNKIADETLGAIINGTVTIERYNPFEDGPKNGGTLDRPANQTVPVNGGNGADAGFHSGTSRRVHGIS